MSQEPWLCNGEDPWLSSKGRTMGVGKLVLCSHGPSSIVWIENGPCCMTIAYFVGGKEGRIWFNVICLKLYQFKRITWWCLFVLEFVLEFAPQYVMLGKIFEKIMVPENFRHAHLQEVGSGANFERPWNLIHSSPCRTPCRRFIHEVFFGPLGLRLGRSPLFQPMRDVRLQWSRAFSLVWEVALSLRARSHGVPSPIHVNKFQHGGKVPTFEPQEIVRVYSRL